MNNSNNISYALELIDKTYISCNYKGLEAFVLQLTNENIGFNWLEIEAITKEVEKMTFDMPTHISILPIGAKTSRKKGFDGLVDIFCNDKELAKAITRMKEKPITNY